jgi:hypothetical protein
VGGKKETIRCTTMQCHFIFDQKKCTNVVYARGNRQFCRRHYTPMSASTPLCKEEGCEREKIGEGDFCHDHRWCLFKDCVSQRKRGTFCVAHYFQMRRDPRLLSSIPKKRKEFSIDDDDNIDFLLEEEEVEGGHAKKKIKKAQFTLPADIILLDEMGAVIPLPSLESQSKKITTRSKTLMRSDFYIKEEDDFL